MEILVEIGFVSRDLGGDLLQIWVEILVEIGFVSRDLGGDLLQSDSEGERIVDGA